MIALPLILHVPHAGTKIPDLKQYTISEKELAEEQLLLTDWHTDDLFSHGYGKMIRAEFSRIFCDPERFVDDAQEIMSEKGMGVLYELRDNGDTMRNVSAAYKNEIIQHYYQPHHTALENAVQSSLNQFDLAVVLDCHSFPDQPFQRDIHQKTPRPDFNIGTDPFHTPSWMAKRAEYFFSEKGYTVGVDWPYSGALVPMKYYQKNKMVHALMLEINRKLYLKDGSSNKNANYEKIKKLIKDFQEDLLYEYFL